MFDRHNREGDDSASVGWYCKYEGNTRDHLVAVKYKGNKGSTREIQGKCKGNTREIQGKYKGNTREIQGKYKGNAR